jgi:hypothetical protein
MVRYLQLFLCASLIAGCDRGLIQPPRAIVRDSLGVRIVEHSGNPSTVTSIEVAANPSFLHGTAPADYSFQRISDGALLPDGGAVILDSGNQEAILIEEGGKSWRLLAASGEGPDEIRRAQTIHAVGQSTVIIEDDGNSKFMMFSDGAFTESVGTRADVSLTSALMIVGFDAEGRFIMTTSQFNSRFEEPWFQGSVVRFDLAAFRADTIARFDMAARSPRDGPYHPFGAFGIAISTGGGIVLGRGDLPELRWLTSDGELKQIVRWEPTPVYPTDRDVELFAIRIGEDLRRVNPGIGSTDLDNLIERQRARYRVDQDIAMPLYRDIYPDDVGRLWIEEFSVRASDDGAAPITVMSMDGQSLGVVDLPDDLRILDIRQGRILGVVRDDLDVQSVAVLEFKVTEPGNQNSN